MHVRSLGLLIAIFGVSAALAGYIGKRYEPAAPYEAQPPTPAALPSAPPAKPARVAPPQAKPEAAAVAPIPARQAAQPMTLQSAPETRTPPRNVAPPPLVNSAAHAGGPITADQTKEAPRTTGSNDAAAPKCNQQACADAYRSFDASDCTYLPAANAARRLCKK